jgi:transposase
MAALWKIEGDIRGLAPAARMAARQQRSAAIVAELFDLWKWSCRASRGSRSWAGSVQNLSHI